MGSDLLPPPQDGPHMESLYRDVVGEMPALIQGAVAQYRDFSSLPPPLDAKGFAAHHAACRATLAHVEALTKLSRWLAGGTGEAGQKDAAETSETPENLLGEARAAIAALSQGMEDDDNTDTAAAANAESEPAP
ncbi:MAG: hypothetical protein ISR48_01255 [Alphaproteobacteria bacterium]|nr:hypothetical protein [Alphaproteobacteria bacterium]